MDELMSALSVLVYVATAYVAFIVLLSVVLLVWFIYVWKKWGV